MSGAFVGTGGAPAGECWVPPCAGTAAGTTAGAAAVGGVASVIGVGVACGGRPATEGVAAKTAASCPITRDGLAEVVIAGEGCVGAGCGPCAAATAGGGVGAATITGCSITGAATFAAGGGVSCDGGGERETDPRRG
ncbi:MAG: hypothetical protein WCJ30_20975, partial [Deltaproteobacteria bacterium]